MLFMSIPHCTVSMLCYVGTTGCSVASPIGAKVVEMHCRWRCKVSRQLGGPTDCSMFDIGVIKNLSTWITCFLTSPQALDQLEPQVKTCEKVSTDFGFTLYAPLDTKVTYLICYYGVTRLTMRCIIGNHETNDKNRSDSETPEHLVRLAAAQCRHGRYVGFQLNVGKICSLVL